MDFIRVEQGMYVCKNRHATGAIIQDYLADKQLSVQVWVKEKFPIESQQFPCLVLLILQHPFTNLTVEYSSVSEKITELNQTVSDLEAALMKLL
jgi:hypothetical protein